MLWKFHIVAEDLFGRVSDTVDAGGVSRALETFARHHPELQGVTAVVTGKLHEREATIPFLRHYQIENPPPTLLKVGRWREAALKAELDAEYLRRLAGEIDSLKHQGDNP